MLVPPAPQKQQITEKDIQGLKYFKLLNQMLQHLHDNGTQRDKAGNRQLFFDQYASLILLYYFNPVLTSLRSIQFVSGLRNVQRALGVQRTSLASLSEAARVFDSEALKVTVSELAQQLGPLSNSQEAKALAGLTAVDGSLLPALPKMAWALWNYDDKKAARLHLHFDVFRSATVKAEITAGKSCEKKSLMGLLDPNRFYVMDRGYEKFALFQAIVDTGSSFVCSVRDHMTWSVIEERPLTDADRQAGVVFDAKVNLGGKKAHNVLTQPYRVVIVERSGTVRHGEARKLILVTDRFDLAAELIALAYRYRWQIELFFRWLKCILGCQHLLSTSQNGVEIQVYLALIASLLITLWLRRKPTKRSFEMLCLYFQGWAQLDELIAYFNNLEPLES